MRKENKKVAQDDLNDVNKSCVRFKFQSEDRQRRIGGRARESGRSQVSYMRGNISVRVSENV